MVGYETETVQADKYGLLKVKRHLYSTSPRFAEFWKVIPKGISVPLV
jgi:hypothetical protein